MLLYVYLDHRNANYSAYIEVVSVELYVEEISAKLSVKEISIISRVADILSYMNSFGLFLYQCLQECYSETKEDKQGDVLSGCFVLLFMPL